MVDKKKIRVEVSNRHVHLSQRHVSVLFGRGHKLRVDRGLSQPGQFASREKVRLVNISNAGTRRIENVRVLGPSRGETQVEISRSDAIHLRLNPPLRVSEDLGYSPGIIIMGPRGWIRLREGVIISHRHLHASNEEAEELGIKHGDVVMVKVPGKKSTILGDVFVRVGDSNSLSLHIDRDDGNACFIDGQCFGELVEVNI